MPNVTVEITPAEIEALKDALFAFQVARNVLKGEGEDYKAARMMQCHAHMNAILAKIGFDATHRWGVQEGGDIPKK